MAIKINTEVYTSEGPTTGLYFHITEFYRNKEGDSCQFPVKYYTDPDMATACEIFEGGLKKVYTFDLSEVVGTEKTEKLAYDAIGAELKAVGLAPESDGSGEWVAY